jgi:ribose transport system substrate-binding protein
MRHTSNIYDLSRMFDISGGRMFKRLMVAAAMFTVACAGKGALPQQTAATPARPVVGVSLLTQSHTFYKDLEDAMQAEAKTQNLDLIIVACEMDPAKQASQMEDFIAQKVSALIVAPCDSTAIVPYVQKAQGAGIPVFSADIAVNGARVTSHVASDNFAGGKLAAQTLAGLLHDRGKVLIIDHPDVASVQDRTRGFEEEMKKHPGIVVVGRPSASGQRAKAMAVMEDMLQAHRDLNGVFGINDDSALGAAAVLEAAGRTDVVIVGFDGTAEAQAAIRKGGPLKADIVQHPREIGTKAIELIARHLAGEKVPPLVSVAVAVIDAASLPPK